MTENIKDYEVLDCPYHRDKIRILRRLKKIENSSNLVKSPKSETDDGLSCCSNFPERPILEELEMEKPVLPEIEHLRGKVTDDQLEAIKDVLDRNQDVFSKHKAGIGCCNFVEHEIELEESAVPYRGEARRMTPNKSDACRKEIGTLLEYEEDALWPLQCYSYVPTIDGTCTDKCNEVYGKLVMCYVDDVVKATPTLEDHIERLD